MGLEDVAARVPALKGLVCWSAQLVATIKKVALTGAENKEYRDLEKPVKQGTLAAA